VILRAGDLDRRVDIQRKTRATGVRSAGKGTWGTIATVWAEVRDMLPSRAERLAEGVSIARRPARVRMRYRENVTPDMRLQMGTRLMRIVAGPIELGRREGIEMVVEDYTAAGEDP
jgi:SPP1 family predicted phage head-tail adaptor